MPTGWTVVRVDEVMDEASEDDDWEVGDLWSHWDLQVDAVMEGHTTAGTPTLGSGTSWST
jgi:hypothetical protein